MIGEKLILEFGNFLNFIFSLPSRYINPFLSPNLMLIGVSILFGWFYGRKAFLGFKTVSMIILSLMMYCTIKFIGGAS